MSNIVTEDDILNLLFEDYKNENGLTINNILIRLRNEWGINTSYKLLNVRIKNIIKKGFVYKNDKSTNKYSHFRISENYYKTKVS